MFFYKNTPSDRGLGKNGYSIMKSLEIHNLVWCFEKWNNNDDDDKCLIRACYVPSWANI